MPASITSSSLTNQTVQCGSNSLTFTVTAAGTLPLNYQWSFDGVPVSNATNASYSLVNVHLPNHTIGVVVTNLYGSIASNAALTVQDTIAPAITLNGGNPMFVELGGTFTDPGATATDTLRRSGRRDCQRQRQHQFPRHEHPHLHRRRRQRQHQCRHAHRHRARHHAAAILWSFTNLVVAANTNCSAVMTNVTGTNFILATDLAGALTISQIPTNTATLPVGTNIVVITVKDASGNAAYSTNTIVVEDETPPMFLIQPQSLTNVVGTPANFSSGATACTPLGYQWLFNNAPLSGQTNSALAIVSVSPASAGNYSVVATAAGGSTTSAVATLTVDLIPASLALNSSDNPAGFKDSLNFTAAMTPAGATGACAILHQRIFFDGEPLAAGTAASVFTAALPRGTNQITAIYSGDANDSPATNSLAQIVTDHPPVAADYFTERYTGLPLDIPVANLASNWSDADGDTVSLAAIGVSTNGVTVTNVAGMLVYWNTNDVDDAFVCTVSDGWGGTNFRTVHVTVVPLPKNAVPAISSLTVNGGNTISLESRRCVRLHLRFGNDHQPRFAGRLAARRHQRGWHKWNLAVQRRDYEQSTSVLPAAAHAVIGPLARRTENLQDERVSEFLQRVEGEIQNRRLLLRGQKILVAVSGGVDSMALLRVLHLLAPKNRWRISVAHFNHRLRGRASDADERLVRKTAAAMKLPVFAESADVKAFAAKSKLSLEMAARKLRHEFLARVARQNKIKTIALAHHADDQVELFFLRLLRGAGGEGLAGMKWRSPSPADKTISLVRPLLGFSKAELLEFARENKIQFHDDATNFSGDFLRNRIRNELLPLLRKNYQPGLDKAVLRLMEIVGAEAEFVGEAARQWLDKPARLTCRSAGTRGSASLPRLILTNCRSPSSGGFCNRNSRKPASRRILS